MDPIPIATMSSTHPYLQYVRNVALDPDNQGVMDSLTQQKAVQRVANFGNSGWFRCNRSTHG